MTRYLFDTSALLLAGLDHRRFTPLHRELLTAGDRFVSHVCAIEIAIKFSIGRLDLPDPFKTDFSSAFAAMARELSADVLATEMADIARLSLLPLLHRDPFDRLIIAQGIGGGMTVITADRVFASYPGLEVLRI